MFVFFSLLATYLLTRTPGGLSSVALPFSLSLPVLFSKATSERRVLRLLPEIDFASRTVTRVYPDCLSFREASKDNVSYVLQRRLRLIPWLNREPPPRSIFLYSMFFSAFIFRVSWQPERETTCLSDGLCNLPYKVQICEECARPFRFVSSRSFLPRVFSLRF